MLGGPGAFGGARRATGRAIGIGRGFLPLTLPRALPMTMALPLTLARFLAGSAAATGGFGDMAHPSFAADNRNRRFHGFFDGAQFVHLVGGARAITGSCSKA